MASQASSTQSLAGGNVASLLECPVCLDLLSGEIYQCMNGHSVCAKDLRKLTLCPVCRVPYSGGVSRNILAESLVQMEIAAREARVELERARARALRDAQQQGNTGGSGHGQLTQATPSAGSCPVIGCGARAVTGTGNPSTRVIVTSNLITCSFISDGCVFEDILSSTQQHEQHCDYRPIACCLTTNGCNNSVIPFFDYIKHLKDVHGVKYYQGSNHVHNYTVKPDYKKLIRGGSTSLFILEVANQVFVVRGVEIGEFIYIWVAFHGLPANGRLHRAEIEFNFQEDEPIQHHQIHRASTSASARPAAVDYSHPFAHTGDVLATTRQTWEELCGTRNYFYMNKSDVRDFLKQGAVQGRHHREETWAITISITRPQPPQGN